MTQINMNNDIVQETTEKGRYYIKDNIKYPSVTWICSYYPKNDSFYQWISQVGYEEAELIKERAGEKGHNIHKAIETYIKTGELINEDESVLSFIDWLDNLKQNHKIKLINSELSVINKIDKYAGTIDLILEIDNELWIIDIKTSKYIGKGYVCQLSAYKRALELQTNKQYKIGIIQIGNEWRFTELQDKYELFLSLKRIWEEENQNKPY